MTTNPGEACRMFLPFVPFLLLAGEPATTADGYLAVPGAPALAYEPREGDLIFYDDHHQVWSALFKWAGSGPPLHMGIVVRKWNGTLAVLEAGPDETIWVALRDLPDRLHQFQRDTGGTITIRRVATPLNRFQSRALTRFAHAQDGKRYAVLRLLSQGTPLRARGPLEPWLGTTSTDRSSWICSELAVAAASVVGLLDPNVVHANSVYPRDLVDNQRFDLTAWTDAATWRPRSRQSSR